MKRVKLIVAYDGTNYHGWQVQNNGVTIESMLNDALKDLTGEDIRVQHSCEVPMDFHPRYQDTVKTYEYRILNREFPLPAHRLNAHFTYRSLNEARMRQAAEYLIGEHDFQSFCAAGAQVKSTVRTIYDLNVCRDGDLLTIRITGNGFLYHMVRIIAGTLMKVGCGEWEPAYMREILDARDRAKAGPTAPAKGLTLLEIYYPNFEKDVDMQGIVSYNIKL